MSYKGIKMSLLFSAKPECDFFGPNGCSETHRGHTQPLNASKKPADRTRAQPQLGSEGSGRPRGGEGSVSMDFQIH